MGRMPNKRNAESLSIIIMKLNRQEINELKKLLSDKKYRINEVLDNLHLCRGRNIRTVHERREWLTFGAPRALLRSATRRAARRSR